MDEQIEKTQEVEQSEVKTLINDSVSEAFEKFSDSLVAKFQTGVEEQRSKVLETEKKETEKQRNITKEFLTALVKDDREVLKTLTTSSADTPKAGYTIPSELMAEVLRIANTQYGVARREMRYLPFSGAGNTRTIPTVANGVTVTWTDEAAAKTSTQPTFGLVTQTLKKLAAIVPMTEELLEDTAINLTQLVADLIAEAIAKEEDTQFLAGTGAPWTGVLNNVSVNSVTLAGTTFAGLTADDLLDMIDKTPESVLDGAKFYMHRSILSVVRKLKASTSGVYIFEGPQGDAPATIWGYPVVTTDVLPALADTAANKKFIIFGNLKKGAIFGDKQSIQVKLLDEATITDTDGQTSINLAQQDCIAMRFVERVGYVLALPTAVTVLKTKASGS